MFTKIKLMFLLVFIKIIKKCEFIDWTKKTFLIFLFTNTRKYSFFLRKINMKILVPIDGIKISMFLIVLLSNLKT